MRVLTFVVLTPYLTRIFINEQEEFGLQSYLYAWTAFLMVLFTFRMETALFRFASKAENKQLVFSFLFKVLVATSAVLGGGLLLFSGPIATFLEYPDKQIYVMMFAGILMFDTLSALPFALLRLRSKPYLFASIKMINLATHIGLILFFYSCLPKISNGDYFDHSWGIGYVFVANLSASLLTFVLLLPTVVSAFTSPGKDALPIGFAFKYIRFLATCHSKYSGNCQ